MKEFATLGLLSWFHNMIPTLLPFMIISNLIMNLNLERKIVKPFAGILKRFYHISDTGIFIVIFGFLFGFPMGAKLISELYTKEKISENEANLLLAFANNIGPAYYIGFVYPNYLSQYSLFYLLMIQYGIPIMYGFILRHTIYKNKISYYKYLDEKKQDNTYKNKKHIFSDYIFALDDAINTGLVQIGALGGYMIVFNVLVLLPNLIFKRNMLVVLFCHLIIEITGGLTNLKTVASKYAFTNTQLLLCIELFLCLNGLCCLFQTIKFLRGTDLSLKKYMLHKILLCSITGITILLTNS